jgi:TIR domain/Pentapeptide repeats (8 copies)
MADPEQLAQIREGTEQWNHWRHDHASAQLDLAYADLARLNLQGANLDLTNLTGAILTDTDLSYTRLNMARLHEAKVTGATLSMAIITAADCTGADLRGANLEGTNFAEAVLKNADFAGAILQATRFMDTDLSGTIGLSDCIYAGPCTIGIDTLFRSSGRIPESFLRGCGVPEQLITYTRSIIGQGIEFYSCFISYSSSDEKFAQLLHTDLRARNLRCWFAPEDLKIGERFQDRIEESIRVFDKVMIVLSETSLQSRWVEREVNAALERENRENRTVLFPIHIDDAVMEARQPWAADIRRSRHIGDFTGWRDHVAYRNAFDRLLRDLRANGKHNRL